MPESLPKRLSSSSPPAKARVDRRLKVEVESFGTVEYAFEPTPNASNDSELSEPNDQEHAPLPETAPRPQKDGSPEPSGDTRIPLWQNENPDFAGEIVYPRKWAGVATRLARDAQGAKLMVEGKPQFNLFVDGSYEENYDTRKESNRGSG
ncbi:hypothetical protein QBC45DRAFT_388276 [Copromyces sp. CBS 386.78]|nr:hypothetical protein QBC45DRAFT_388276 [Copromyces sp. CBS 386.78]